MNYYTNGIFKRTFLFFLILALQGSALQARVSGRIRTNNAWDSTYYNLQYGAYIRLWINQGPNCLAMWNGSYPNTSPTKFIASVVPGTINAPGLIDTIWVVEGGTPGTAVTEGAIVTFKSHAFGTYLSADSSFKTMVAQDYGYVPNVGRQNIPGVALFGLTTGGDQSSWTLGHGSALLPNSVSIKNKLLAQGNISNGGSYLPVKAASSWYDSTEIYMNTYALELWDIEIIQTPPAAVTPAQQFTLDETAVKSAMLVSPFEKKVYNTYKALSSQVFADQVTSIQGLIDESAIVYVNGLAPRSDWNSPQSNFYNSLNSIYNSIIYLDSSQKEQLIKLFNNAINSVLLNATNKTTVQGWIAKISGSKTTTPTPTPTTTTTPPATPASPTITTTQPTTETVPATVTTTPPTDATTQSPITSTPTATTPSASVAKIAIPLSSQPGSVWATDANNSIWFRKDVSRTNPQGTSWINIDGKASLIAVSAQGAVWSVGVDQRAYVRDGVGSDNLVGDNWKLVDSANVAQLSANAGQVWMVGSNGSAYYRAGITSDNESGSSWTNTDSPNTIKYISIAEDSSVWAINSAGKPVMRDGITNEQPYGTAWKDLDTTGLPGALQNIAVGGDRIWAVAENNTIWFRQIANDETLMGTGWASIDGRLQNITVSDEGLVWATDKNGQVFFRTGISDKTPQGTAWQLLDGKQNKIAGGYIAAPVMQPQGFEPEEGLFAEMAVGSYNGDLDVWAIRTADKSLHQYDLYNMSPSPWNAIDAKKSDGGSVGSVLGVTAASDGTIAILDASGQAYIYDRTSKIFSPVMEADGTSPSLDVISIGHKDLIWAVDTDTKTAYEYIDNTWEVRQQGAALFVSVGIDNTIVGLNIEHQLYSYMGNNKWTKIAGSPLLGSVAVVNKEEMWGIGIQDGVLYHYTNGNWETLKDDSGNEIQGMTSVSANAAGTAFITDAAGNIYFFGDAGYQVTEVTTTTPPPPPLPTTDDTMAPPTPTTTTEETATPFTPKTTEEVTVVKAKKEKSVKKIKGKAKRPTKLSRLQAKKAGKLKPKKGKKKQIATKSAHKKQAKHVKKQGKKLRKKSIKKAPTKGVHKKTVLKTGTKGVLKKATGKKVSQAGDHKKKKKGHKKSLGKGGRKAGKEATQDEASTEDATETDVEAAA